MGTEYKAVIHKAQRTQIPGIPACHTCADCYFARSKKDSGCTWYCRLTGADVHQSHFGMNSPRTCPKRAANKKGGSEHEEQNQKNQFQSIFKKALSEYSGTP